MISLQILMKEINTLVPIPAVTNQLLEVVDNPDSSMEDIANVIQYDPAITVRVLKTCNAAYFGLKHPAESVKDAVNMLGTDQIIELVLLQSSAQTFSGGQKGYGLKRGDIWRYSVSSAVIAKQIAEQLSLKNKNTIFTAGLVKDIGKTLLENHVSDASQTIKNLIENDGLSFREAEKKVFGIDHAELGALIAKMWKFSPRMIKLIRNHHLADEKLIKDREVATVHLADCICMMMGQGVGSDGLSYRFKTQAMKELGFNADDVSKIIAEFGINMKEVEELLHIV